MCHDPDQTRIRKTSQDDGFRVLVGPIVAARADEGKGACEDLWMKEIGPSDELRKWFHHEEGSWSEFEKKYKSELTKKKELLGELRKLQRGHGTVTLLYGSKDEKQNQAVVLAAMLKK